MADDTQPKRSSRSVKRPNYCELAGGEPSTPTLRHSSSSPALTTQSLSAPGEGEMLPPPVPSASSRGRQSGRRGGGGRGRGRGASGAGTGSSERKAAKGKGKAGAPVAGIDRGPAPEVSSAELTRFASRVLTESEFLPIPNHGHYEDQPCLNILAILDCDHARLEELAPILQDLFVARFDEGCTAGEVTSVSVHSLVPTKSLEAHVPYIPDTTGLPSFGLGFEIQAAQAGPHTLSPFISVRVYTVSADQAGAAQMWFSLPLDVLADLNEELFDRGWILLPCGITACRSLYPRDWIRNPRGTYDYDALTFHVHRTMPDLIEWLRLIDTDKPIPEELLQRITSTSTAEEATSSPLAVPATLLADADGKPLSLIDYLKDGGWLYVGGANRLVRHSTAIESLPAMQFSPSSPTAAAAGKSRLQKRLRDVDETQTPKAGGGDGGGNGNGNGEQPPRKKPSTAHLRPAADDDRTADPTRSSGAAGAKSERDRDYDLPAHASDSRIQRSEALADSTEGSAGFNVSTPDCIQSHTVTVPGDTVRETPGATLYGHHDARISSPVVSAIVPPVRAGGVQLPTGGPAADVLDAFLRSSSLGPSVTTSPEARAPTPRPTSESLPFTASTHGLLPGSEDGEPVRSSAAGSFEPNTNAPFASEPSTQTPLVSEPLPLASEPSGQRNPPAGVSERSSELQPASDEPTNAHTLPPRAETAETESISDAHLPSTLDPVEIKPKARRRGPLASLWSSINLKGHARGEKPSDEKHSTQKEPGMDIVRQSGDPGPKTRLESLKLRLRRRVRSAGHIERPEM